MDVPKDERTLALPRAPWDGFLVGEENHLAHAGAMALAKGEIAGISPLIVHGPSGAGKSRLLEGLVAEFIARRPESVVAHLSAEEFASQCAEAVGKRNGFAAIRERFRHLDLFVLEDLQALEQAPLALNELAHTLDALELSGAAIVASARMGPGRWLGWPERLVSRLLGGLSVRVDLPGLASRRRFLWEIARLKAISLPAQTIETIAESANDYRTLEGLLTRLEWSGKIDRDSGNSNNIVAPEFDESKLPISQSIERITRAVAKRFGVNVRDLRSASRRRMLVVPRHLAIYLARSRTGASFGSLGAYFGHRDPATIRHACHVAEKRLRSDPAIAAEIAAISS